MSNEFSIDVDDAAVRERIRELKDDYADGATWMVEANAEYSVYIEMGTEDMPPYPFFRPAIREFKANPETFLLENTELSSLDEIDSTDEMVKNAAQALEAQMKVNATAEAGGRSPGTHPEHPQIQSGNLRARISAKRVG